MNAPLPIDAVVCVGRGGRGFVMDGGKAGRVILTAAHCLPKLPPADPWSYTSERTYPRFVGPLDGKRTITVECGFVDPIADIAVLTAPDEQTLYEEAGAYHQFTDSRAALALAAPRRVTPGYTPDTRPVSAYVLTLANVWTPCQVQLQQGAWINGAPIQGGMSGSPVVMNGAALAVVSNSNEQAREDDWQGPQPRIALALPVGWVRALRGR